MSYEEEPLTELEKMPGYPYVLDPAILAMKLEDEEEDKEGDPLVFDDYRVDKTKPDTTRVRPDMLQDVPPPTAKSIRMGQEMMSENYCDNDPRNAWLYEEPEGPFISVVTRREWAAYEKVKRTPMYPPVKHVRFTYTNTESDSYPVGIGILRDIQNQHRNEGLADIAYNFVIGDDGFLYEGRGWYVDAERPPELAHLKEDCLDIAYMGDFKDKDPPWIMVQTALDVIRYGLQTDVIHPSFKVIPYRKN